jgi:hypothetical protein
MSHPSRSDEQQHVENLIRAALGAETGLSYQEERIDFDGEYILIDAVGRDSKGKVVELAEIYARQGKLKGGQLKKPTDDAARLVLAQKHAVPRGRKPRLRLAWCCEEAAGQVRRGWRGKALESMGIAIDVIDVDPKALESVRNAQKRQTR